MKKTFNWHLAIFFVSIFVFLFFPSHFAFANGLTVSNAILTTQDSGANTVKIQFNITWNNYWRDAANYDAAWVFAKYSTDGVTWKHVTLKGSGLNPEGYSYGGGTPVEFVVPTDDKGCFIQYDENGNGTFAATNVNVVWDYNANGLGDSDIFTPNMRLKVIAIEMVYISAASFYIGDGNGTNESSYAFHSGTGNSAVLIATSLTRNIRVDPGNDDTQITSTGAGFGIGIGGSGAWSGLDTNNDGTIDNASFPAGYNPFYIMKYEITEGQWVEFFNTLTSSQKTANDVTGSSGKNNQGVSSRNTLVWPGTGNATTTRSDRACNYLTWQNVCAYADWAGLRPMTELEFEKACRGSIAPVYSEYAWGGTGFTQAATISGTENGSETITNSGANGNCLSMVNLTGGDGGMGPLRAGIFATGSSTRAQAGAGYYGAMELSGNLNERAVTVGNSSGRSFQGTQGDGSLTGLGYASNTDWPGYVSGSGVSDSNVGGGFRGGGWSAAAIFSQTSERSYASKTSSVSISFNGGRLVRTAP